MRNERSRRRRAGRASHLALWFLGTGGFLVLATLVQAHLAHQGGEPRRERNRRLVSALQLTDLTVNSEARYTRHISQADLFSAFQDTPGSFEHMPSGSLFLPPRRHVPWRQAAPVHMEVKR